MTDPAETKPAIEPTPPRPVAAKLDDMNAFLDIGTAVSLAVTAVFLISGAILPFVTPERKERSR